MDDRLDAGHPLAAAERLQRLPEIGELGGQERHRRVGRVRLGGWDSVDVEDVVAVLEQVSDHRPACLAAPPGDGDLGHGPDATPHHASAAVAMSRAEAG
jgi:hypothetical protein